MQIRAACKQRVRFTQSPGFTPSTDMNEYIHIRGTRRQRVGLFQSAGWSASTDMNGTIHLRGTRREREFCDGERCMREESI